MLIRFLKLCLFFYLGLLVEYGLFRFEERRQCKKNKGDCSKCKAWSCMKGNIEYENNRKK